MARRERHMYTSDPPLKTYPPAGGGIPRLQRRPLWHTTTMRATVPPDSASPDSPGWISEVGETLADAEASPEALQRGVELLVAQGFVSFAAVYDAGADGVPPLLAASRRDTSPR